MKLEKCKQVGGYRNGEEFYQLVDGKIPLLEVWVLNGEKGDRLIEEAKLYLKNWKKELNQG